MPKFTNLGLTKPLFISSAIVVRHFDRASPCPNYFQSAIQKPNKYFYLQRALEWFFYLQSEHVLSRRWPGEFFNSMFPNVALTYDGTAPRNFISYY